MKVLHISTIANGGAANSAVRLHESLIKYGVNSFFLTLEYSFRKISNHFLYDGVINKQNYEIPALSLKNWFLEKFFNFFTSQQQVYKEKEKEKSLYTLPVLSNGVANFTLFSYPNTIYDIMTSSIYKEADIIHLHWVANFIDFETFFSKIDKPVIWTLHDEYAYLGGFHYQDDVDNNLLTHSNKESEFRDIKKKSIKKCEKLTIISPSNWIADKAKKSEAFSSRRVKTIRYNLDKNTFKIRDLKFSRDLFQIPQDKKIILVASQDLSISRKGVSFVEEVLKHSNLENFVFVFAGSNLKIKHSNIVSVGTINDEIMMSCLYSAADYFLLPSTLDNLPNTLLESLYCGTPVIAFKIGDFDEIFECNNIGILVNEGDVNELKKVFDEINNNEFFFDRNYIVSKSHQLFSEEKTINQYINEYNNLLNQ